jgi:uncharacterized glyoxalase superfamily protein PhnB
MKKLRRLGLLAALLTTLSAVLSANAPSLPERASDSGQRPKLVNTCLITKSVSDLVRFYAVVLERDAEMSGVDYAEFHTDGGVLAIFSARAQDRYIPGSATSAGNQSVVLEFEVSDVDREYRRLQGLVKTWVKAPTTQPWGTRSIYFRDPEGNLVDFTLGRLHPWHFAPHLCHLCHSPAHRVMFTLCRCGATVIVGCPTDKVPNEAVRP